MRQDLRRGGDGSPGDERHRSERAIALARVVLAAAVLFANLLDPLEPEPSGFIYSLLAGYLLFSLLVVAIVRARPRRWTLVVVSVHLVDLAAAAALMLVGGYGSPVLVLVAFGLMAAAHRWSFRETVATAAALVVLLLLQALVLTWLQDSARLSLASSIELRRLGTRSALFLMAGVLMGYVAHAQKQLRAEAATMAAIMSGANLRLGLSPTMALAFDAILRLFDAKRVVLVVQEIQTGRISLWQGGRLRPESPETVNVSRIDPGTLDTYMFCPEAAALHAVYRGVRARRLDIRALDENGARTPCAAEGLPQSFLDAIGPFHQLMALGVDMPGEWKGRIFLIDPHVDGDRMNALALGQRVVRQLGPPVSNVYLLRRLRSRSAANARGRVARELHDGIIQSVLGVQIQLHALGDPAKGTPPAVAGELMRLGTILRDEVVNLRDLMQRLNPLQLTPDQLMDTLGQIVQRFQRETGINARFITPFDRLDLPPTSCLEVTRIVQEGLVNVRKHSGARHVLVRLDVEEGICRLSIQDDGRGFAFEGRLSQAELEKTGQGPWIIKERVRLLGGEVAVESSPGQGARLVISFPVTTYANQG